jgi:hypothetical protein
MFSQKNTAAAVFSPVRVDRGFFDVPCPAVFRRNPFRLQEASKKEAFDCQVYGTSNTVHFSQNGNFV